MSKFANSLSKRITLRITDDLARGVDEIIAETPASNDSEVGRRAIANYIKQFRLIKGGARIIIEQDVNGVTKRTPIFL